MWHFTFTIKGGYVLLWKTLRTLFQKNQKSFKDVSTATIDRENPVLGSSDQNPLSGTTM